MKRLTISATQSAEHRVGFDEQMNNLHILSCGVVRDLAPPEGMKLNGFFLLPRVDRGMGILCRMKELKTIWVWPRMLAAADF